MIVLALGIAGCGPQEPAAQQRSDAAPTQQPAAPAAVITTNPADAATGVRPDTTVQVGVQDGLLSQVSLTRPDGEQVPGKLARDGLSWESTEPLTASTDYTLTVRAHNGDANRTDSTARFSTLTPADTQQVRISPREGASVGIAMPVTATFSRPVTNKAAAERRLVVESIPLVQGAWHWDSDTQATYRPRDYWPGGTRVTVHRDLNAVELAEGLWGVAEEPVTFTIGAATRSVVDLAAHTMTVHRNGQVLRTIPITAGKQGMQTRIGTKVIMSRETQRTMNSATVGIPKDDPDYYLLNVRYAMRLTNSGEFLHAAPWSAHAHGKANVSHGCTGMSTDNARWLMGESKIGDPVEFVGGTRPLHEGNGWTLWNVPFEEWKQGSALD
ncbi:MAG: hypothetical protein CSA58_04215 [Micrococcales bacterium]|nr:MAG: hypothetical protein CSA58_04215 [Micrococcales bacterium]